VWFWVTKEISKIIIPLGVPVLYQLGGAVTCFQHMMISGQRKAKEVFKNNRELARKGAVGP